MGITDNMWEAITTVIKLNDKIERMAATIISQQQKIEGLTERVIRLETVLEIGLARGAEEKPSRSIAHKD
jgi:hypothetical protein